MPRNLRILIATFAITISMTGMSGCHAGDISNTSLGDVSVGQQLLDLKAAYDQGAISEDEYTQAKQKFLSLLEGCECNSEDAETEED